MCCSAETYARISITRSPTCTAAQCKLPLVALMYFSTIVSCL